MLNQISIAVILKYHIRYSHTCAMPFFHGAHDVQINNTVFTDIAGNYYNFRSKTSSYMRYMSLRL